MPYKLVNKTLVYSLALACLIVGVVRGQDDDVLRRSYETLPERRALLQQARTHFFRLEELAEKGELHSPLTRYEEYLWLLQHRIPAVLVIERQLARVENHRQLALILDMCIRIGHSRLLDRLPDMLPRARSRRAELLLLRALARVRTPEAVEALARYIRVARAGTPDEHLGVAALGLGRTGNEEFLPVFWSLADEVESRPARAMVAAARCLCGEEEAGSYLIKLLEDPDTDEDLRLGVISLVEECRPEGAVAALAELARTHADEETGRRAFDALLTVTDYIATRTGGPLEGADGPPPEDEDAPAEPSPETRWAEGTEDERKQLVDAVVEWHLTSPATDQTGPPDRSPPDQ